MAIVGDKRRRNREQKCCTLQKLLAIGEILAANTRQDGVGNISFGCQRAISGRPSLSASQSSIFWDLRQMATVSFEGIWKVFNDFVAIPNLDLEIKDGEFIVFVGPSGCGKTTTLRMLAGLETPTHGRILIDGQDVTLTAPGRRD